MYNVKSTLPKLVSLGLFTSIAPSTFLLVLWQLYILLKMYWENNWFSLELFSCRHTFQNVLSTNSSTYIYCHYLHSSVCNCTYATTLLTDITHSLITGKTYKLNLQNKSAHHTVRHLTQQFSFMHASTHLFHKTASGMRYQRQQVVFGATK